MEKYTESKNTYKLPVDLKLVSEILTEGPTHKGQYEGCVDFALPEGSPIYAARDGLVMHIKADSNVGGDDEKYFYDGNMVAIRHDNGEESIYEHLKYKGVEVKVGEEVKVGQLIGYSGNTGITKGPHLHFQVFYWTKENPDVTKDFQCVLPKFNYKNQAEEILYNKLLTPWKDRKVR